MRTNLLNAKPQKEFWEVLCRKEASLESSLPLIATGEKGQGLGLARTAATGAVTEAS